MYSRQEESAIRKQFWTSFGQYLAPIPAADGNKVNWINYKTGIRFINFKMDAERASAYIGIEISHTDLALQEIFFNHFKTFQDELDTSGEEWIWEKLVPVNGKTISRIYQTLQDVNIYLQPDWPAIISFLKTRIISLDRFWINNKDIFEMLA